VDEGEGAVKPEALLIITIHVVDSAVERGNKDVLPGEIWFETLKRETEFKRRERKISFEREGKPEVSRGRNR
jgi:hypothetical protein